MIGKKLRENSIVKTRITSSTLTYHGSPRAAVLAEDEGGTY